RRDAEYGQVVVDVWCANLRAPVEVEEAPEKSIAPMGADASGPGGGGGPVFPAGEREVRLSAQRLLAARLRAEGAALDVDLTGAVLLYADFDGCRFGRGVFANATMIGGAGFAGAVFEGESAFTAVEGDVVRLDGARFAGTVFLWGNGAELELDDAVVGAGASVVGDVVGWTLTDGADGKVFVRADG
ncbi:MAG TPA: pentapeptide repeat-containing protein, partial [Phytomonospora sp.]